MKLKLILGLVLMLSVVILWPKDVNLEQIAEGKRRAEAFQPKPSPATLIR